jgi:hypothetical protein
VAEFGEVIETKYVLSTDQLNASAFGNSPVYYSGSPIVYSPGDVINLPYTSGELSTMEAVGLAWAAYASGIEPT